MSKKTKKKIKKLMAIEILRWGKKKIWLSDLIELAFKHGAKDMLTALKCANFFAFGKEVISKRRRW